MPVSAYLTKAANSFIVFSSDGFQGNGCSVSRAAKRRESCELVCSMISTRPSIPTTRNGTFVSLINTLTGMAVDVETRRPRLKNVSGGLSGPAIRPIAVHMVHKVVQSVGIPVMGMGGITDHWDALEFLIVGATAVQVGTANFINPKALVDIIEGLRNYCIAEKIRRIRDIIGTLKP